MEIWAIQNADDGLLAIGAIIIIAFFVGYPICMGVSYLIKKCKNGRQ